MARRFPLALLAMVLIGTATMTTPAPATAADPLVVSGYDAARVDGGWGLFSNCGESLRDLLTDPANFGPGGTVERPITLAAPGVNVVSPGALDGVDVFFTGWVSSASYTDAERQALLDFVLGGGMVIATTDDTGHNIADLFGVTLADSSYATATPTETSSPLIDGPFGVVTSIGFAGNQGIYSVLGPATPIATADPDLGPAVALVPPGALGPTSGAVVLVADIDVFTEMSCASPPGGLENNTVFAGNLFAYLAGITVGGGATTTTTTTPTTAPTTTPTTTTTVSSATTAMTTTTRAVAATPRFTG